MNKMTFLMILVGVLLAPSQAQADPLIQVIQLFDEQKMIYTGVVDTNPVIRDSKTVRIVRGAQDMVILSSTPDGSGIPNMDDFLTINGEFVQRGLWIPLVIFEATGSVVPVPDCINDGTVSVDLCSFPRPHQHPVDVSDVIPVGLSTVTADMWDFGGGYGHTELYLIIVPPPLQ